MKNLMLKPLFYLCQFLAFLFISSCSSNSVSQEKVKQYQDSIVTLKAELKEAKDLIAVLKYPADQRFEHIKELFKSEKYADVRKEIEELAKIFPNAKENTECELLLSKIKEIELAKKAEEERLKALGFKAIKEQTKVKVDYNTIAISSISIGNQFVFDAYDDRWFYRDADRGSKFLTMKMSVTSTSHNPKLPELAVYTISGDKMILDGTFDTRFARWSDYGSYLGNYHDSRNDFSKVSTISFKLGVQINTGKLSKPYAIVLMKKNCLTYHYDRFSNPPISYEGSADYPSTLSLSDFKNKYVVIKKYNL